MVAKNVEREEAGFIEAGQRSPRNTLIVEVLRDYGYVDAQGMGVRTKRIPLMKEHSHREPFFEATEDYLKTDLLRLTGHHDPKNAPLSANKGATK